MNEEKKPLETQQTPQMPTAQTNQTGEKVGQVQGSSPQPEQKAPQPVNTQVTPPSNSPKKKGGNFKYVLTVILFLALFAVVFFLPDISEEIKTLQKEKQQQSSQVKVPEIKSGVMSCTLSQESGERELSATVSFNFTNKKLKSTKTETLMKAKDSATGDDLAAIEKSVATCAHLKELVSNVDGFTIQCSNTSLSTTQIETVDYEKFELKMIEDNIAEFGANVPEFQLDQDIDELKRIMVSSGYNCEVR